MHFLKLNELIIHPIASGIISSLFLLGVYWISAFILNNLLKRKPTIPEIACSFMILLGIIGSYTYFLALLGCINVLLLRVAGYPVCILGGIFLVRKIGTFKISGMKYIFRKDTLSTMQRVDIVIMFFLFLAFFFCVWGPPTDSDSLNYHLGIPLEILRNGCIQIRNDWLHSHLIGIGEFLNLFGLGLGTDNLGAFIQFSALCWITVLISNSASEVKRRIFVSKLIAATPLLLFLVPSQKPQLIGSAAIISALVLILERDETTPATLLLALGSLFFCMSLKYSFYIVGSGVFILICSRSLSARLWKHCIIYTIACYALFLLPIHLRNFLSYGDPLSPLLLSLFKPDANEHLFTFYTHLKNYTEGFGLPLGILFPDSPGAISSVIGFGIFSFLFINAIDKRSVQVLVLALFALVLNTLLGQHTARFFLDTYFLIVLSVAISPGISKYNRVYSVLMSMQLIITATLSLLGAWTLFPGALSFQIREQVMRKNAYGYSAMQWIDKNVPPDAFIISEIHSNALIPRPFLAENYKLLISFNNQDLIELLPAHLNVNEACLFLITTNKITDSHPLCKVISQKNPRQQHITIGTRNPFNNRMVTVYLYSLNLKKRK